MTILAELESQSKELSSAIENLVTNCQRAQLYSDFTVLGRPPQSISHEVPAEIHQARESVLAILNRLQIMLAGPTDFLRQLATQVSRQTSSSPFPAACHPFKISPGSTRS